MGFTPLEGLVMGSRAGDLDPGILIYLLQHEQLTVEELDEVLNRRSGLVALAGTTDMRDIVRMASDGDLRASSAINFFCHRIRKYLGAYAASMNGLDAIVFTGGIGEHQPQIRYACTEHLDYLGIRPCSEANSAAKLDRAGDVVEFSMSQCRVRLLAVATDEQQQMVDELRTLIGTSCQRVSVSCRLRWIMPSCRLYLS